MFTKRKSKSISVAANNGESSPIEQKLAEYVNSCKNDDNNYCVPTKLIKLENHGLLTHNKLVNLNSDESSLINAESIAISSTTSNDTQFHSKVSPIEATFDVFLQEMFSWNPEWLQGRALTKPPMKKCNQQMKQIPFKHQYTKQEYIARHIPFIHSELFIKLSDAFKNDAPSRTKHNVFINDCVNYGESDINKKLVCYSSRNIYDCDKPVAKNGDILCLEINVVSKDDKNYLKRYFGVITGHLMLELSELESQVFRHFLHLQNQSGIVLDKYTIITKRSRETSITIGQMARMEVMLNASAELKQVENLSNCQKNLSKLTENIMNATANVYQYSELECSEKSQNVRELLRNNAINMISKASPMVFVKGITNIMVTDINSEIQRLSILFEVVVESISANKGKLKFLVIAKNEEVANWWRDSMKSCVRRIPHIRSWKIESGHGWTRHVDIKRFIQSYAKRAANSCKSKLDLLPKTHHMYQQLIKRRKTYQNVINSYFTRNNEIVNSSTYIAKHEILQKAYEKLIRDCNVIIGTAADLINCFPSRTHHSNKCKTLFDCCIVDDAHSLPDVSIFSVTHFGAKSYILSGDSECQFSCGNPYAHQNKFNTSLFHRLIMNAKS